MKPWSVVGILAGVVACQGTITSPDDDDDDTEEDSDDAAPLEEKVQAVLDGISWEWG